MITIGYAESSGSLQHHLSGLLGARFFTGQIPLLMCQNTVCINDALNANILSNNDSKLAVVFIKSIQ